MILTNIVLTEKSAAEMYQFKLSEFAVGASVEPDKWISHCRENRTR